MKSVFTIILLFIGLSVFGKDEVVATLSFKVTGLVSRETEIKINDLLHYKQDTLAGIDAKSKIKGVLLKTILDAVGITNVKHKEYGQVIIILTASDGYINTYTWNELYKTDVGNHVLIITEIDGKIISDMKDRILAFSMADIGSAARHLKGLSKIEIRKIQ